MRQLSECKDTLVALGARADLGWGPRYRLAVQLGAMGSAHIGCQQCAHHMPVWGTCKPKGRG